MKKTWDIDLCVRRLWRSRTLSVNKTQSLDKKNKMVWMVSGGAENHIVNKKDASYICDCPDFLSRDERQIKGGICKHIIAVMRHEKEKKIINADKILDKLTQNEENIKEMNLLEAIKLLWLLHQGPSGEIKEDDRLAQMLALTNETEIRVQTDAKKNNKQPTLFDFK